MAETENDLPPESLPAAKDQAAATPEQAQALTKISGTGGMVQITPSEALLELESSAIRGNAMLLWRVIVGALEGEAKRERAASAQARAESDSWRDKYYAEKETTAVLQERLRGLRQIKVLQNALQSVGGVFCGVGAKLLFDKSTGLGTLLLVVGAAFLVVGWLQPPGSQNEPAAPEAKVKLRTK